MRLLFALTLLASLPTQAAPTNGEVLPNWASPAELEFTQRLRREPLPTVDIESLPQGFHIPAEFEPVNAVMMTYAGYGTFLTEVARDVANSGVQVYMVGGPDRLDRVSSSYYQSLDLPADTVWARDYGPMAVNQKTGERILIDPIYRHYQTRVDDDHLPTALAGFLNEKVQDLPIIIDGGNLMVDGRGRLFMTERTYDWNAGRWTRDEVNSILKKSLGVSEVHALPYARRGSEPADGTGHIDMFAKLLDVCTVVVAETQSEPFKQVVDTAAEYFRSLPCADGGSFKVYRVPGWVSGRTWFTYTNSLIVNDTIIIPGYANAQDEAAVAVYQKAAPRATIRVVNSDGPIRAGGAVHCTTRELPGR